MAHDVGQKPGVVVVHVVGHQAVQEGSESGLDLRRQPRGLEQEEATVESGEIAAEIGFCRSVLQAFDQGDVDAVAAGVVRPSDNGRSVGAEGVIALEKADDPAEPVRGCRQDAGAGDAQLAAAVQVRGGDGDHEPS